ncbi:tRNA pseudouridine synthase-like 1 [Halotydeus destructor]|nr:tRNA pseudouridine synthase-like 1 [Halotydeus destructor]
MPKYFIRFSYLGARYLGVQRIIGRDVEQQGRLDRSIQLHLERAVSSIRPSPVNLVTVNLSSRTDKRVNALDSAVQVHLLHPDYENYDTDVMTKQINHWFLDNRHEILVRKIIRVDRDFRIKQNVNHREYTYRAAFAKRRHNTNYIVPRLKELSEAEDKKEAYRGLALLNERIQLAALYPIVEKNRLNVFHSPDNSVMDVDKLHQVLDMYRGTHDFRSFQAKIVVRENEKRPETVKNMTIASCEPVRLKTGSRFDDFYTHLNIVHFRFRSTNGFLYKQIRRMVGCAIECSQNKMSINTIKEMLDNPRDNAWCGEYYTAPSQGLFLSEINYRDLDKLDLDNCHEYRNVNGIKV